MNFIKQINRFLLNKIKLTYAITLSRLKNIAAFFKSTLAGYITDFKTGDIFVKLSLLFMSIGFFRRHQVIKGILFSIIQIAFILFMIFTGIDRKSVV